jgi:ribulose-5-phosphate 4-epimerase/fuculose-1-phosphate aldolase
MNFRMGHGDLRLTSLLVFAAAGQPIAPVLESSLKFGLIKVARFAPAHSKDLADHIAAEMKGQEASIRKQAAAVIAPWHGLFTLGKDLDAAFDAVERVEVNAIFYEHATACSGRSCPFAVSAGASVQRYKDRVRRYGHPKWD